MSPIGTNFYWIPPGVEPFDAAYDYPDEALHIGKRSGAGRDPDTGVPGCSWSLQGHEEVTDTPVVSWRHWRVLLGLAGGTVQDEYGRVLDVGEFVREVEETTPRNRRRSWEWLREHYHDMFPGLPDDHVPEGEGPRLGVGDTRTWLDPEGFSVTFREFS